jgi:dTDP-4-dehydrorhamnose 3,5-epimerase
MDGPADMTESDTEFTADEGYIVGAKADAQSVTADWQRVQDLIAGVKLHEVKNVPRSPGGYLTEVYRRDWQLDDLDVDQVFQSVLEPGQTTAWHAHRLTTDRIFVNWGMLTVVLYDARGQSRTFGRVNEFLFGSRRPAIVVIPPGVWHGIQNRGSEPAALLNLVDRAYSYDEPDHWRLPVDTPEIPYRFEA